MGNQRNAKHATLKTDSALIIFGKAPIPGLVKTRLCPPLTPDEAATLQGSLVLDVAERSRSVGRLDRFLACTPSREHVFFKVLEERQGLKLMDQVGDDLGARMDQAFRDVFALGYKRLLLVGTDVPTLPASAYSQALDLLSDHDLVLGPSEDGGYYLIGLKKPAPGLFTEIPWSTEQVCALTRKKAEALGLKTALLPVCRDIDRVEDLLALAREAGLEAIGNRQGAIGTEAPPKTQRPAPSAQGLSHRTAGVIQMLAGRLKSRSATLD